MKQFFSITYIGGRIRADRPRVHGGAMRAVLSLCLLLSFIGSSFQAVAADKHTPKSVTIGFIPGEDPEWLKKNGLTLAQDLQSKLDVPINIYISKNYEGLVDAMRDKKVDFAFFSALTFVDAEKRANAKPLLKKVWEEPYYYSAIITLKKSGIKTVADLKGKRFGFVDEKSASGHLYPLVMLYKKGLDPDHFFKETKYFGTHENSVKALINGDVDAVAVYSNDSKNRSTAWTRFAPDHVKEIKVLWTSEPIPNDPFCVRTDFYDEYPQFTLNMMAALIDYQDEPAEKNVLKNLFGVKAMAPATSRQYDPVRELARVLNEKKKQE